MDAIRLRELLEFDPLSGVFLWKVVTRNGKGRPGQQAGCVNGDGYLQIQIDGARYRAHRLAWLHVHGQWPPDDIDHINGDRADNRLANLRLATRRQNSANRVRHINNGSGFKGITFHPGTGKWRASIYAGKRRHLGLFETKIAAHEAYCAAAREAFGEFWRAA